MCDRMKMPSIPARTPSAGAWPGPVRDLLGGETSPAAFRSVSCSTSQASTPALYLSLNQTDSGDPTVTLTIKATYQNGVLKPKEPLALAEGTEVEAVLHPVDEDYDPLEAVIGIGDSGRTDGADQHDHYIYGTPKR